MFNWQPSYLGILGRGEVVLIPSRLLGSTGLRLAAHKPGELSEPFASQSSEFILVKTRKLTRKALIEPLPANDGTKPLPT